MHENRGPAGTDSNEPLTLPGPGAPPPPLPGTEAHDAPAPVAPGPKSASGMRWIREATKALPTWDLRFKVAMVASFLILVTVLVVNRSRTRHTPVVEIPEEGDREV